GHRGVRGGDELNNYQMPSGNGAREGGEWPGRWRAQSRAAQRRYNYGFRAGPVVSPTKSCAGNIRSVKPSSAEVPSVTRRAAASPSRSGLVPAAVMRGVPSVAMGETSALA